MQISIKLMGLLRDKSPPGGILQLPDGATIEDALHALTIESESIQVFTVNGQIVRDRHQRLQDGDALQVLPPVGGG